MFKKMWQSLRMTGHEVEKAKQDEAPLLPTSLPQVLARLRNEFGETSSFVTRTFTIGSNDRRQAAVAYIDGLINPALIDAHILKTTMVEIEMGRNQGSMTDPLIESIFNQLITVSEAKIAREWDFVVEAIASGDTVFLVDGARDCIIVSAPGWERRSVSEPVSEAVVRGPRDGFTETLITNETLIRRRIKSPRLWFERMSIGDLTKTSISIVYIKGVADEEMVAEVKKRLDRIEIDGILESGYLEEFIQDSTWSIFPLILRTERPDIVCANLLEGRVAVITDNTPFVLIVPVNFSQLLTSPEDYYERFPAGSLIRMLRYLSFLMSLTLPGVYIAITTFHQELLPTDLVLAIAASRQGVPFPALVEALLMEVLFEILREAGIRLPRVIGQAVSIVGALVVGEAAVSAGLVSPAMVIVVAMTAISSFATPHFSFALSGRMLRFGFMFSAATLGLFGIQLAGLLLLLHIVSIRSFGVSYLEPFAPLRLSEFKDAFVRLPIWSMRKRPESIPVDDRVRQTETSRWSPSPDGVQGGEEGSSKR